MSTVLSGTGAAADPSQTHPSGELPQHPFRFRAPVRFNGISQNGMHRRDTERAIFQNHLHTLFFTHASHIVTLSMTTKNILYCNR